MATRMKDDERRLLGAAQTAGRLVPVAEMTEQRFNGLRKKWLMLNLIDADGNLTGKGHGASGGVKPSASVEGPVVLEAVVVDAVEDAMECEPLVFDQGTYIGSPLIDDNELESPDDV